MKIFINPGHTPQIDIENGYDNDCGACGFGMQENIIAKSVADLLESELEQTGFEVENFQSSNLYAITDKANLSNADIFISIHCNAANGTAQGTETFYCEGSAKGKKIASAVQKNIVTTLNTINRGVKDDTQTQYSRIHVLRKTKMPAILIELAFIDNKNDANLLQNYQWRFANATAKGIAEYCGLKPDVPAICPACGRSF